MDRNRSGKIMTQSQQFLLTLVRMSLWGTVESLPETAPDWEEVLSLAHKQTLIGLVAEAVPMLPDHLKPAPQLRLKLHATAMRIVRSHVLLDRKVAEITTRMSANGIDSVILKGQGTALNYPNPQSRQCGDIDLYVGEKNFGRCLEILLPDSGRTESDFKYIKHFDIEEDGVVIEVHRVAEMLPSAKTDKFFQDWTKDCLETSRLRKVCIGGSMVNLPPAEFDAVYIMYHAWHHFLSGGVGLRQLCDWTMHLHRFYDLVCVEELHEKLSDFDLLVAWKVFACVAVSYLGLPAEQCPLYDSLYNVKAERVMQVIWDEGNFGKYSSAARNKRPDGYVAGKLYSLRKNTLRLYRVIAVSPSEVMKSWFSYFYKGFRNLLKKL